MSDKKLDIKVRHSLHTADGTLPMKVNMAIPSGSILAITGPSGSGKTTFLKQLAGLITPQSGSIIFGQEIWLDSDRGINIPVQQRNIGFVFQDYALFPHMSVKQNLEYALEKNIPKDIIYELLKATDLEQLADRKPHQLSGGQQQRVALARALVRKPRLLLLDEPLSALDPGMRQSLQELLLRFQNEFQFTMIIVTHDVGEIFYLADQVAFMENGQITKSGTPMEVYSKDSPAIDQPVLYGQVLSVDQLGEKLTATLLIQQKPYTIELPVIYKDKIHPGQSFTIPQQLDVAQMRMIND